MINQLSKEIHKVNVDNGFYENEKNIGEMLALIHSEVSEALECDRKGKYADISDFENLLADYKASFPDHPPHELFEDAFKQEIKDTFEDELADIMIRVMDLAAHKGIDLEKHIALKVKYNSMREYKHGKKY